MNGAPDWQDGECCFRCRTQFTLVARKHHCRNCGNIFCAKCSSQQIPLPKLNIEKDVRVCDTCYEKISSKNEDPLTLALGSKDKEQTKPKLSNSSSKSMSSSNNKPAASASAPSEQELKEEEEFQLALALSLSETPTKVSFPDCRHFEEPSSATSKTTAPTTSTDNIIGNRLPPVTTNNDSIRSNSYQPEMAIASPVTSVDKSVSLNSYPSVQQAPIQEQQSQTQLQPSMISQAPPMDYHIQDRDREVFKFVGEVQSTLEVFTNRLESCKLRNRPISNDAAIQSQFLRLNAEIQPKLSEYIKTYDEERADYERLQDKLSQIGDARAALDSLREEHQEKMRQQAAEADRLRQTQLATKLEAMRQKKSQMMQYQRELALQRIREQEMVLQQQQQHQPAATQGYQVPPVTGQQQVMLNQQVVDPMQLAHQMHSTAHQPIEQQTLHQEWHQSSHLHQMPDQRYTSVQQANYTPTQQHYQGQQIAVQPPTTSQVSHVSQPQQYVPSSALAHVPAPPQQPIIDRASIAHLERQFLPNTKPEEDAPLISFDD